MRIRHVAIGLAAACSLFMVNAPAQAHEHSGASTPKPTFAKVLGKVKIDRHNHRVGYVHAKYRCTGTGTLWVSVKQVADRSADPALAEEGSSQISAAWSDSHRNPVYCDGKVHIQKFTVDQEEPFYDADGNPAGPKSDVYGPLKRGFGYVQFCLFDDLNPETGAPVSDMTFHRVVKKHHKHHHHHH
jgi:hypothetical protein